MSFSRKHKVFLTIALTQIAVPRLVLYAQLEEDVLQRGERVLVQQDTWSVLSQEPPVPHEPHDVGLSGLLDVVGGDDDGLALVAGKTGQVGPDAGNSSDIFVQCQTIFRTKMRS